MILETWNGVKWQPLHRELLGLGAGSWDLRPKVSSMTSWRIQAVIEQPRWGKLASPEFGEWRVHELRFYVDLECTQEVPINKDIGGMLPISSGYSVHDGKDPDHFSPWKAFDNDMTTYWAQTIGHVEKMCAEWRECPRYELATSNVQDVWIDDGEEMWIGADMHQAAYDVQCISIFQSQDSQYRAEVISLEICNDETAHPAMKPGDDEDSGRRLASGVK